MAGMSRRVLGGLLCAALLAGCATKSDLEAVQDQAYHDRQENERTIQRLQDQLSQTHEQLHEEIQNSTTPVQTRQASTWAELESVRGQVAQLQEQLGSLTMRFNTLTHTEAGQPSLADMAKDVQNIKIALQSQLGIDVDGGAPAKPAAKKAAAAPAEKPEAAQNTAKTPAKKNETAKKAKHASKNVTADALYARAEAAFRAKDYDTATQYYSEFFTTFKKSPKAPDAAFWVGECAYRQKDYGKAVLAYQEVIEKFPRSSKYRPAVLRQGMAFYKVGKDKAGRAVLQDLIDRHPKSPEALRAKKFLKEHK